MTLGVVILAAGKGTRMKSAMPKVLHPLGGKPLLAHVIETARALRPERIVVVYGHGGDAVPAALDEADLRWVEQARQLGTGHALQQALPALAGVDRVLVLYGDVPLLRVETLRRLCELAGDGLGLLTQTLENPQGYGRIVRDAAGRVQRIVEQRDAGEAELAIREINTGIMLLDGSRLADWLGRLSDDNAQGEYYLTDLISMAVAEGIDIMTTEPTDPVEAEGVNDRVQLASLERAHQRRKAEDLMRAGVSLADPARFDLRGTLEHGEDVSIDINVIIEGRVKLGDRVRVGANTVLRDVVIGDDVLIREQCVLEQAEVGAGCTIGPFARLRPGARLGDDAHVGNFVEIKNATLGRGAKANHLSYLGDADIGAGTNIGAGTITCNYDGAHKHRTVIGERAFIGSNTSLVAPVSIGDGATIGAGSVVSRDAPAEQLTVTRAEQVTVPGWQRPQKKPKD
jgi:bifunctional UDP-N-acetylglucosamine pyrophosphorylase/glucosamine-1-phosphate N-acetyltransferase